MTVGTTVHSGWRVREDKPILGNRDEVSDVDPQGGGNSRQRQS